MVVSPGPLLIQLFPPLWGNSHHHLRAGWDTAQQRMSPLHCCMPGIKNNPGKRCFHSWQPSRKQKEDRNEALVLRKLNPNYSNYTCINTLFAIKMHTILRWEMQLPWRWEEGNWRRSASLSLAYKILKKSGPSWMVVCNLTSPATTCKWVSNPARAAENL